MAGTAGPDRLSPPLPEPVAPVTTAAAVTTAPVGWPCLGCGGVMPLDADSCTQCGRAFLSGDSLPSLSLPVVGDVGKLDKMQRAGLMLGGVVVVTAVFVLLAFLLGSIL